VGGYGNFGVGKWEKLVLKVGNWQKTIHDSSWR